MTADDPSPDDLATADPANEPPTGGLPAPPIPRSYWLADDVLAGVYPGGAIRCRSVRAPRRILQNVTFYFFSESMVKRSKLRHKHRLRPSDF